MKLSSEQRLQHLERLCGQLLAQNHRLIERNAQLMLEIQTWKQGGHIAPLPGNIARMSPRTRPQPVR